MFELVQFANHTWGVRRKESDDFLDTEGHTFWSLGSNVRCSNFQFKSRTYAYGAYKKHIKYLKQNNDDKIIINTEELS